MNQTRRYKQLYQSACLQAITEETKAQELRPLVRVATGKTKLELQTRLREAELSALEFRAHADDNKRELERLNSLYPGQGDVYSRSNGTYVRSLTDPGDIERLTSSGAFAVVTGERGRR